MAFYRTTRKYLDLYFIFPGLMCIGEHIVKVNTHSLGRHG